MVRGFWLVYPPSSLWCGGGCFRVCGTPPCAVGRRGKVKLPFVTGPHSDINPLYLAYTVHYCSTHYTSCMYSCSRESCWSWDDHCGQLVLECSDLVVCVCVCVRACVRVCVCVCVCVFASALEQYSPSEKD